MVDPKILASKLASTALQHNWSEAVEVSADKNGSIASSAPHLDSPRVILQKDQKTQLANAALKN